MRIKSKTVPFTNVPAKSLDKCLHFWTFKKGINQMSTYNLSWTVESCSRKVEKYKSSNSTKGIIFIKIKV